MISEYAGRDMPMRVFENELLALAAVCDEDDAEHRAALSG